MKKCCFILLVSCAAVCVGREPFKPADKSVQFMVYFMSRYRGLCVGSLVSRMVVLTASVCVIDAVHRTPDTRPITVIAGSTYRHPRRGIRVQVTKILVPKMPEEEGARTYLLEKAVAALLLKRKVPDILAEVPLRAIDVDWQGEETLRLHQECLVTGWHFFYQGDKIYPVSKFLLQRSLRVQFMRVVKMHEYCDTLSIKFQKALANVGYEGYFDETAIVCLKDGMYGAPLVCQARQVGILLAPDGQWTNCTGHSNIFHLLSSTFLSTFLSCISSLFDPDIPRDWGAMTRAIVGELEDDADLPAIYDRLTGESSSMEEENVPHVSPPTEPSTEKNYDF